MEVAYVSALSALAGSVVGGLISGVATWLSQREQVMAGKRAHDQARKEDLYRDFIVAASKAVGEALTSNDPKVQDIVALYAMISRMRVVSSARIVACAENVMLVALDTYFAPNKTISEVYDTMKRGGGETLDLLREFSELARDEVRTALNAGCIRGWNGAQIKISGLSERYGRNGGGATVIAPRGRATIPALMDSHDRLEPHRTAPDASQLRPKDNGRASRGMRQSKRHLPRAGSGSGPATACPPGNGPRGGFAVGSQRGGGATSQTSIRRRCDSAKI